MSEPLEKETLTKDDFIAWKNSPITKVIFHAIRTMIREGEEELGNSAGVDPHQDRYIVGKLMGLKTVLTIEAEEVLPEGD